MRTNFIYLIILTLLSSCIAKNQSNPEIKNDAEIKAINTWILEYKNVTFQRCLYLGFNRSTEIFNLLKLDRSTAQDFPFGINQYRYIDTIVQPVIKQAKLDSAKHYNKYLKGMNDIERDELNGKPMIKFCLQFYVSDKLEEIARERVTQMDFLWKEEKSKNN